MANPNIVNVATINGKTENIAAPINENRSFKKLLHNL